VEVSVAFTALKEFKTWIRFSEFGQFIVKTKDTIMKPLPK